jgi:hypothetical protein
MNKQQNASARRGKRPEKSYNDTIYSIQKVLPHRTDHIGPGPGGLGIATVVPGWVNVTPVAAQVIAPLPLVAPWTAIGASGTVDESSILFFGFLNASAGFKATASVAPLEFRYNVVNTHIS